MRDAGRRRTDAAYVMAKKSHITVRGSTSSPGRLQRRGSAEGCYSVGTAFAATTDA
jgi:hypothetical protein